MRHLTVSGFGDFLGVHGNRLIVRNGDNVILETALSRLRTIRIDKSVSLSSNLILACAARGIRIYFLDWKGVGVVEVSGMHRHAVVGVRKSQFECLKPSFWPRKSYFRRSETNVLSFFISVNIS